MAARTSLGFACPSSGTGVSYFLGNDPTRWQRDVGAFEHIGLGEVWPGRIEQLAREGITGGCGATLYCPDAAVTRGQMAVLLVRAFDLPI